MYKLRKYQQDCLEKCIHSKKGGLCILPTGSGKSHIIGELCNYYTNALVLTPRIELMKQNIKKIKSNAKCITINSAYIHKIYSDVLIVDECHLIKPKGGMYQDIISNCKLLFGFTATPCRVDGGELLGLTFFNKIYEIDRKSLIEKGFLAKRKYINIPDNIILNVKQKINIKDVEKKICKKTKQCIDHFLSISKYKQALIYACDINHANKIQYILPKSKIIHGKLTKTQRAILIEDFTTKKLNYLINCEILTTGFDYPDLNQIVILRPTSSFALYEQICGRGDRITNSKKHCDIYDYTLNSYYFKEASNKNYFKYCIFCMEITDYRLIKCKHCKKKLIKNEMPTKSCHKCKHKNYARATYCMNCNEFIKSNVSKIIFNKIYYKFITKRNIECYFGPIKFYGEFKLLQKIITNLFTKHTKKNNINGFIEISPLVKSIAYYKFNWYKKENILLKIKKINLHSMEL